MEPAGKVQTVLGVIDADSLGKTICHEHLLFDLSPYFSEPSEATEKEKAYQPITLNNLSWVRTHRLNNLDNLQMKDLDVAIQEAQHYKSAGGDTIVEVTNVGLSRDPVGLADIARATGLNVIMGSGYYVEPSHPPELAGKSEEEITEEIVKDITVGVGDSGVRAGIIGEIGCTTLTEDERKVLRAAAAAQHATGAALSVHPPPSEDLLFETVNILSDSGADLSRTVICHVDLLEFSLSARRRLADAGCYLEFDTFGHLHVPVLWEGHLYNFPSEMQRIEGIMELIDDGYLNQILVAQDHCFKDLLTTYGGQGYAHILRNILPVMRAKSMSDEQIDALLIENPKRLLQFAAVKK